MERGLVSERFRLFVLQRRQSGLFADGVSVPAGDSRRINGAPGRIRTCDRRIRSPLLCPLSYGRALLLVGT